MFEQRNRKLFALGRVFWSIVLCCALTGTVLAGDDDEGEAPGLQGTWRVAILPGTPNQFFSLMEFDKGGTMTEVSGIAANSTSVGVWEKVRGQEDFAATFELFFDGDADGRFDSRYRVRLTIRVSDGDTFTGTATLEVLTLDGATRVAGPFPGIPLEGRRMKVTRE